MKKYYLAPEMSISQFEAVDVVTTSGGETTAVQTVRQTLETKKTTLLGDSVAVYATMEF